MHAEFRWIKERRKLTVTTVQALLCGAVGALGAGHLFISLCDRTHHSRTPDDI